MRNCLTTPFIIEADDDIEAEDEEKFIKEKTEIFPLVMCLMMNNKEIFQYLWKTCSYLWNEIHLVLLANFVFEAAWADGIRILFASAPTIQIFNQMNLFEKEKFLKFCDKSVAKIPGLVKDFMYHMAFSPYNVYYLPLVATDEELKLWEKELTKELFFKNCYVNFDERTFVELLQYYKHFVKDLITVAPAT